VERGDLISVKEPMKKTRGRNRASLLFADYLIDLFQGVLKFQRALSLLGSNLASVGVL
jgi:hypothetical protein